MMTSYTNATTMSAEIVRNEDELEGSLLPVATKIEGEPTSASSAVPMASFDYNVAMADEREQQREQVAFIIPQNERAATADDSRSRVSLAQQKGLIASEEEKEAIRRANRQIYSKDYYSQQAVQAANTVARRRDFQGLQVSEPLPDRAQALASQPQRVNSDKGPQTTEGDKLGYEVNEYQLGSDFETTDYQIGEYNSMYS